MLSNLQRQATVRCLWAVLLCAAVTVAAASPPPPPISCPPQCAYNSHFRGCGIRETLANGSTGFVCPKALLFSVGFDDDMVLQRAPAKAAVYGHVVGDGVTGASVAVTVTSASSSDSYTVQAQLAPAPTYCLPSSGTKDCAANYSASWKAYLKPAPAGGEYTITAVCAGCDVGAEASRASSSIGRVTFGDVYFCSGQSNMALSNTHSYSAKQLQAEMVRGRFDKLRWFQFESMGGGKSGTRYAPVWARQTGASFYQPPGNGTKKKTWFNASYGAGIAPQCPHAGDDPSTCPHVNAGPFFSFSAACAEFGRNLLEMLGESAPPIGLIQSAIGGSTIEAWSPNATTASCQNKTVAGPTAGPPRGHLFYGMVCPFVNTTLAGWVWYQGENDVGGWPGSSLSHVGYGCMQSRMVAAWRELWSPTHGTTDPLAPFGLVTIAPSGSEGAGHHLSAFRWSQTANYGVMPNPALPRTFLAQAYDLNDPWAGVYRDPFDPTSVCSDNASLPHSCTWTNNGTSEPPPCCECGAGMGSERCVWDVSLWNRDLAPLAPLVRNSSATPQFMGSLHPRLKEPVGRRLAAGLVALQYGGNGTVTGPTLAGCKYDSAQHTITVRFNKTLLKNDAVAITRVQTPISPLPQPDPEDKHPPKPTRPGPVLDSSLTHVCTGDAEDCACLSWKYIPHPQPGNWTCEMPVANAGQPRATQPTRGDIWTEVAIRLLPDKASVAVDTSGLNVSTGGVHAIKFGWSENDGTCCIDLLENTGLAPCIPGSCGLMTSDSLLPANPFFAVITADGKCKCPEPQTCDGE